MKKPLLSVVLICSIVLTAVLSCTKTNNKITPVTPTPSLASVFSGLNSTPQTISVAAGVDTAVFTSGDSTVIHFYANSFMDANGNTITSGVVSIQVTELYSPGEIIANHFTTVMPTSEILQTCGQVKVTATMGGKEVYASLYQVGFRQHAISNELMGIFSSQLKGADSITTWMQTTVPLIHGTQQKSWCRYIEDTMRCVTDTCYFYDSCRSFNTWMGCSWFVRLNGAKAPVSVILPDTSFNATNTQIFLVLPKSNAGWTGNAVLSNMGDLGQNDSCYVSRTNTLMLKGVGYTNIAPVGLNYELVVISKKGADYYYWSASGVMPSWGVQFGVAMTKCTPGDILQKLGQL